MLVSTVRLVFTILVAATSAVAVDAAKAEIRVALVIGNGDYGGKLALPNPVNDASDVAASLKRLDFSVILKTNLDKVGMDAAFGEFAAAAEGADVALFYYAGHAMELGGRNYLMPLGARLETEATVPYQLSRVDDVLDELRRAAGVRIAVLDACRDNPLADELKSRSTRFRSAGLTRGLARIDNAEGMLVVFATQPGKTAEDGTGRNSPFTVALLRNIETPGLEVGQIFTRVAKDVYEATGKAQLPDMRGLVIGEFYMKARGMPIDQTLPTGPAKPVDVAETEWNAVKDTASLALLQDYINRYPQSAYAGLTKSRMDELTWNTVRDSNSPAMLNDFIVKNPASGYVNQAKARIEEFAWSEVKDSRNGAALDDFMRTYPSSIYVNTAKAKKEEIAWSAVKESRNIPDLQSFISDYPTSIYANYARIRIDELTPDPVEEEVLAIYSGVDFYGGDIAQRTASNLTDCAQLCADNGSCRFFTYVQRNSSCILKNSYEFATLFDGATAGQYVTSNGSGNGASIVVEWELGIGRDYFGNDFQSFRAIDFHHCLRVCSGTSGCNAFSFAPKITRNDNCWLKSFAGTAQDTKDTHRKNIHIGKRVSTSLPPTRVVTSQ